MRIVENSPARLRFRDRTLWYSVAFFAAAFFLMAVFFVGQGDHRAAYPAAFFALFGLAFLRSSDAVFDKAARVCSLRQRKLLRVTRRQFGFDDIDDVRLEAGPVGGTSGVNTYRLSLITASEVIPLQAGYEASLKSNTAMREALIDTLYRDRPQPGAVDPVVTLVKGGRYMEAVRILQLRDGLDLANATERVAEMREQPGGASG